MLDRLSATRSADEVRRVLAVAVLELDDKGRARVSRRVGEETSRALRALLAASSTEQRSPVLAPSPAKIRERWEKLWADLTAAVQETGTENGRYLLQEHHWEEPYLDLSGLVQDLEPIAAEMRKLIPKAIALGLEPGLGAANVLAV